jgi:hypothetical protein
MRSASGAVRGSVVGVAVVDRSSNAYEKLSHVSPELIDPYKRSHATDFTVTKKYCRPQL